MYLIMYIMWKSLGGPMFSSDREATRYTRKICAKNKFDLNYATEDCDNDRHTGVIALGIHRFSFRTIALAIYCVCVCDKIIAAHFVAGLSQT